MESFPAGIRWAVVLRWEKVTTGSGPAECYGGPVSLLVRVRTDSGWSEWGQHDAMIDPPPSNLHPTPTLGSPSAASISYNAVSSVSMTVASSKVFTAWEYRYVCWEANGERFVSAVGNTWPASPTVSGLDETASWTVTTGGDDDQCFSRPQAAQAWLLVRVKSASTEWSDWVYHPVSIDLAPAAPTFTNVSHDAQSPVAFGDTVEVSARVGHSLGFRNVQRYASCRNRAGDKIESDKQEDEQTDTEWVIPVFRDWDVTTGDGNDECYHTSAAVLFARVFTSAGWSQWGSALVPVADPTCTVDVPVDMKTKKQDKWFVDREDLYRRTDTGVFSAKRYRITLPNSTDHFPVAINVTSATDFKITLAGSSSLKPIETIDGSSRRSVSEVWYSGRMVTALGVTHSSYTIEVSTEDTDTTDVFTIDIEWFKLKLPTNLKANGDSTTLSSGGQALVEWSGAPIDTGYIIRYQAHCEVTSCPNWTEVPVPAGRSSHTISNLTLSQLYTIQMKTKVGTAQTQNWTDSVYVYPTTVALTNRPGFGSFVGPVRIWVQPTFRDYRYVICVNTLPADDPRTRPNERVTAINALNSSLEVWETSTHGMVRATQVTSGNLCAEAYETRAGSTVEFANEDEMRMRCSLKSGDIAAGCADNGPRSDPDKSKGVMSHIKISLYDALLQRARNPLRSCAFYAGINLHEGGHAFGLHDTPDDGQVVTDTVMDYDLGYPCSPTEYDVAAVKAVHQSLGG